MAAPILADASAATGWVVDHGISTPPQQSDMAVVSSVLDSALGAELAGAQSVLGVTPDEILLAALGRAVARTIGEGTLAVDIAASPAPRRAYVQCVSYRDLAPTELLAGTRGADVGVDAPSRPAEFLLSYRPERSGPTPDSGRILALHVHHDVDFADVLHMEWRYDSRSFDRSTVEELSEQFPLALIEVTSG